MSAPSVAPPADPAALSPRDARALFRAGLRVPTSGYAAGYTQANLIALPRDLAFDFLLFAQRNPKACPVLDVTEPGETSTEIFGGDLRTDLPAYRVYVNGEPTAEPTDVRDAWRDDLVGFLIGCSFTFETPLLAAGVPVRHIELGRNVPMYRTSRPCRPAGRFSGPLVVSMRPIPADRVADAVRITSRYPAVHGAPVHIGDPGALGITDLGRPDFGEPVPVEPGEVPVFWACGVTPQAAVMASAPEFAIGHAPGHMAVTDVRDSSYQVP
ncbi:putative hydro-lyase [Marinitenerispora sediminis]|uniref:Putative hydro-lyase DEF24_04890 n=1 Tax=Marinitenerispora sediminis TaxID=1931232 RepID=A0A368T9E8_9ACTN|nr:putative hydro-lyase [Marinitenerispora sediminis]RCV54602.1 putative hydro-lyase [Marinitenerispora sediminis]RCV59843.1 putative hydro-lyase [Marinitenerispora sediminis]RCV61170.1 putative hydro-lyase [Marinitenerispora sediminis]